eukprot:EG_transcript_14860
MPLSCTPLTALAGHPRLYVFPAVALLPVRTVFSSHVAAKTFGGRCIVAAPACRNRLPCRVYFSPAVRYLVTHLSVALRLLTDTPPPRALRRLFSATSLWLPASSGRLHCVHCIALHCIPCPPSGGLLSELFLCAGFSVSTMLPWVLQGLSFLPS